MDAQQQLLPLLMEAQQQRFVSAPRCSAAAPGCSDVALCLRSWMLGSSALRLLLALVNVVVGGIGFAVCWLCSGLVLLWMLMEERPVRRCAHQPLQLGEVFRIDAKAEQDGVVCIGGWTVRGGASQSEAR